MDGKSNTPSERPSYEGQDKDALIKQIIFDKFGDIGYYVLDVQKINKAIITTVMLDDWWSTCIIYMPYVGDPVIGTSSKIVNSITYTGKKQTMSLDLHGRLINCTVE